MNEIVQALSQKFGLSPEISQQVVQFLLEQVKGKLPDGLGSQLEGFLAAGSGDATATAETSGGGLLDTVKNLASDLLGKA